MASWLFGLAYFLSGSFDDKFLWIAMLVGLGGAIVSTALTVIDRVMMKERYIDVVWYSMSLLIEIAPAGFAIAAVYKTIGSSEALCSTGLLMIIVPMCYTYVEMISRCVLSKLGSSQQMEVIT
ncbi:MAG: hypothetical protein Q8P67_13995 [archaeon]|nr:hypothetical protein [archaeon]